ncbi:hypothetical protein METHP14_600014 [Pseudomonas sp. P14-2025]
MPQRCGSGRAREEYSAVDGTGFARVRGQARSHRDDCPQEVGHQSNPWEQSRDRASF